MARAWGSRRNSPAMTTRTSKVTHLRPKNRCIAMLRDDWQNRRFEQAVSCTKLKFPRESGGGGGGGGQKGDGWSGSYGGASASARGEATRRWPMVDDDGARSVATM